MSYPYLPWDSQQVRELRGKVQKKFSEEEFLAWLIYRRVSLYLSLFLSSKSQITPNLITSLAIILAILGAFLPWLKTNSLAIIGGVFVVQLSYILDLVDGEVARLKGLHSIVGKWLDRILEGTILAATLSLGASALLQQGANDLIGLWISVLFIRTFARVGYYELRRSLPTTSIRVRNHLYNFFSFLTGPLGFMLTLALIMLLNLNNLILIPYIFYTGGTILQVIFLYRSLVNND